MKKVFMLLTCVALVAGVSCKKNNDPKPSDNSDDPTTESADPDKSSDPSTGDETLKELTITMNVNYVIGSDYAVAQLPGDQILEFFDMTDLEFYKAMGTYEGSSADGTTSQVGNTIQFGLAEKNNHDDLKFTPSTCNNFGHWVGTDGQLTWWYGRDEHGWEVCAENLNYDGWGLETPTDENLEDMFWFGIYNGQERAEGDKFKFTDVYYYPGEEDEPELLCYVEWNVTFVAAEKVAPADPSKVHDATVDVELDVTSEGASQDISATVLDAFQLTADEFQAALVAEQISSVMYVGEEEVEQTANGIAGNWFDVNGNAIGFGDVDADENPIRSYYVELGGDLVANVGFYDSDSDGVDGKTIDTYKQVVTFAFDDKAVNVTVNYTFHFDTI